MGKDWKAKTGLLAAVLGGDSESIRLTLSERPYLRSCLDDGENPLIHCAARQGNAGAVRALAAAGFDVNAKDANGLTPLLHAVDANRLDCILPLVEFGADTNATGPDGYAALHLAVRNANPIAVAFLCHHGADPNVPNAEMGATPLHIACFLDRDAIIPHLMDLGADPLLEDVNGLTPVALAAHEGNQDARRAVLKWLREHADDEPDDATAKTTDDDDESPGEDGVFTTCDWCGREIRHGNACLTVGRTIEQVEWNEDLATEEVQVIDSESLLSLCASCGNSLDTDRLRKKLRKRGLGLGARG